MQDFTNLTCTPHQSNEYHHLLLHNQWSKQYIFLKLLLYLSVTFKQRNSIFSFFVALLTILCFFQINLIKLFHIVRKCTGLVLYTKNAHKLGQDGSPTNSAALKVPLTLFCSFKFWISSCRTLCETLRLLLKSTLCKSSVHG